MFLHRYCILRSTSAKRMKLCPVIPPVNKRIVSTDEPKICIKLLNYLNLLTF